MEELGDSYKSSAMAWELLRRAREILGATWQAWRQQAPAVRGQVERRVTDSRVQRFALNRVLLKPPDRVRRRARTINGKIITLGYPLPKAGRLALWQPRHHNMEAAESAPTDEMIAAQVSTCVLLREQASESEKELHSSDQEIMTTMRQEGARVSKTASQDILSQRGDVARRCRVYKKALQVEEAQLLRMADRAMRQRPGKALSTSFSKQTREFYDADKHLQQAKRNHKTLLGEMHGTQRLREAADSSRLTLGRRGWQSSRQRQTQLQDEEEEFKQQAKLYEIAIEASRTERDRQAGLLYAHPITKACNNQLALQWQQSREHFLVCQQEYDRYCDPVFQRDLVDLLMRRGSYDDEDAAEASFCRRRNKTFTELAKARQSYLINRRAAMAAGLEPIEEDMEVLEFSQHPDDQTVSSAADSFIARQRAALFSNGMPDWFAHIPSSCRSPSWDVPQQDLTEGLVFQTEAAFQNDVEVHDSLSVNEPIKATRDRIIAGMET